MNFPPFLYAILLASATTALLTENERLTYVGGADVEEIREDALALYGGINASMQSTVYSSLRFTCSGSITSVWFVASESETDTSEPDYPEFALWRNNRIIQLGSQVSLHRGSLKDRRSPPSNGAGLHVYSSGDDLSLYQYVLDDPMDFGEGDVFGINQNRQSLLEIWSLDGGGVKNYRFVSVVARNGVRQFGRAYATDGRFDLEPLIAIKGTNSSCFEGFLDIEALQLYMEVIAEEDEEDEEDDEDDEAMDDDRVSEMDVIPPSNLSYVFPSLQVVEDGVLEKWLFAADIRRTLLAGQEPVSIQFQVWRHVKGRATLHLTTNVTSLIRTGYPNVYEYTVDPPQPVLTGDFVGVKVQLPSSLRPLWQPGNETAYHLMADNEEEMNASNFAGFAIPLFAAQVRVTEQEDVQVSSTLPLITPSQSPTVSSSILSMAITSAAGPTSSPTTTISTASSIPPMPTASLASSDPASTTAVSSPPASPSASMSVSTAFPVPSEVTSPTQTPTVASDPSLTGSPANSNSVSPSENGESRNLAGAVAGIVTLILLLVIAAVASGVLILCLWRKKCCSNRKSRPNSLSRKKSGFFDNPVYDHLQRKVSKDSQGYATIYDHVYLEVPEEKPLERGPDTKHGDDDSGYAELEVKITAPSLRPGEYSQLTASPSPCSSPYPRGSPSPCPSPARSPAATAADPVKFHSYHTLDSCPVAEEYLEPHPSVSGSSETFLRKATCSQEESKTSSCEKIDHEYHELEPTTGGYHRLQHNLTGIYVPTQAQRRESVDKEDIYTTIEERLYSDIPDSSTLDFFEERPSYWRPACTTDELYSQLAQNKYREILHSQIKLQHVLGSGNFGEVSKGEWQCGEGPVEVAVKTLKSGSTEEEEVRFLQEAAIMGQFRHPNIVQLLGVVTLTEQVMMVLEFLSQGDLGTFLINRRPISGSSAPQDTPFLLLGFCRDVASGMEYLQRKAFIHRDLAARNILVSHDNQCKIGDFGLSRDLLDENYYITKGGMIPWRWTAPEALHYRKYSTASDVWSFGCLMYEIWSLGHAPFEKLSPPEVQVILEKGERLAPPPGCPRGVYSLMIDCWHPEHNSRPPFLSLLKTLASSPSQLLSWSHEDTWGAGEAITLGASLQTGETLYPKLQHTYTQKS